MSGNREEPFRQDDEQFSSEGSAVTSTSSTEEKLVAMVAKYFLYVTVSIGLGIIFLLGAIGWRSYRVEHRRQGLAMLGVEYKSQNDLARQKIWNPKPTPIRDWVSDIVHGGIAEVRICKGDLNDQHLDMLATLNQVHALELRSDEATDETLKTISRMPKLKTLTLDGRQFSIFGLLQLRESKVLRTLYLDKQRLTPIELAVLEAELPQVTIAGFQEPETYDLAPVHKPTSGKYPIFAS
jgi:hypothetical protein